MHKIITTLLPDAGKPDGRCPDCGPHGNRGLITLFFWVEPCVACEERADARAKAEVARLHDEVGSPGATFSHRIERVDGRPWARKVTVETRAETGASEASGALAEEDARLLRQYVQYLPFNRPLILQPGATSGRPPNP